MRSVYVVRAIPVRDDNRKIIGWVRVDIFADGSNLTDVVYLRGGLACSQAEAVERIQCDLGLLFTSEAEAVRDGFARLRRAHKDGKTQRVS